MQIQSQDQARPSSPIRPLAVSGKRVSFEDLSVSETPSSRSNVTVARFRDAGIYHRPASILDSVNVVNVSSKGAYSAVRLAFLNIMQSNDPEFIKSRTIERCGESNRRRADILRRLSSLSQIDVGVVFNNGHFTDFDDYGTDKCIYQIVQGLMTYACQNQGRRISDFSCLDEVIQLLCDTYESEMTLVEDVDSVVTFSLVDSQRAKRIDRALANDNTKRAASIAMEKPYIVKDGNKSELHRNRQLPVMLMLAVFGGCLAIAAAYKMRK